jgi:adenine-specific DNA-methyltransferase
MVDAVPRLNYIGSKYQLLGWLKESILKTTGWPSLEGKCIGDLFAGTGIVSYFLRLEGAAVQSNDVEQYSSVIAEAFSHRIYTNDVKRVLELLNTEVAEGKHLETAGFITKNYCPLAPCERKFFTVDNGRRIDYCRKRLEEMNLCFNTYMMVLASLLLAADAVSNVPAVYGCFLKNFKAKANKPLILKTVHTCTKHNGYCLPTTETTVLDPALLAQTEDCDAVYLDPPYNERQYSKNYFPLNMIKLTPAEQETQVLRDGVTGIPETCFMSPFCQKKEVEGAFSTCFAGFRCKYIFVSYNSESLMTKEQMLTLMRKFGTASVIERDYKRFKSYEYNEDKEIKEYLFCLTKCESQSDP